MSRKRKLEPPSEDDKLERCGWVANQCALYKAYHDDEWGVPVHDDVRLFEMLCLEGMQAGLSWLTVLKKRASFRERFHNFDIDKVAAMSDEDLEQCLGDASIIRHRKKIFGVRTNALAVLQIQREFGSLNAFIWSYVPDGKPIMNKFADESNLPSKTALSDRLAHDLKGRGMSFIGSTIVYAFLQAVGVVNDHTINCFVARREDQPSHGTKDE
jgi:DNA-3-methyladenine glycosylase I